VTGSQLDELMASLDAAEASPDSRATNWSASWGRARCPSSTAARDRQLGRSVAVKILAKAC